MPRRSARIAAMRSARERERRRRGQAGGDTGRDPQEGRRKPKRTPEEIEKERKRRKREEEEELEKQKHKESAFKVASINFHQDENERNHHTSLYEKDELVVRRGQVFSLSVELSSTSPFDPKKDLISLTFEIGNDPTESTGTRIKVKTVPSLKGVKNWAAQIMSVKGYTVELQVMTSAAAFVGEYKLTVTTVNKDIDVKWVYNESQSVIVLFNAWCKDDAVYMPDEEERNEYVLNDNGMIWQHDSRWHKGKEWFFGQFEEIVLDCALFLLYEFTDQLKPQWCGNPVAVTRTLSALINSQDDDGVLTGNWSGDYEDGVNPSAWSGSVKIIKQFMETKESVCYGQCWVFSGVFTTLGRTLGIPTRSVTNIDSAHDTDGSVTIDKYYNADTHDWLEDRINDSVWNFHVWNDCWFKRSDLPSGFDGWQALDSTPQEESSDHHLEGTMCCGPAPLKAIKEGQLAFGSDTAFIYAEVNGDKVYWAVDRKGEETATKVYKDRVGRCLLTKMVGEVESPPYGDDIKYEYKYRPSEPEADKVRKRAVGFGTKDTDLIEIYGVKNEDVTFTCEKPKECTIGDNLQFKLKMKNTVKTPLTVSVKMQVRAAFYTGVVNPQPIKRENITVKLPAGAEKEAVILVQAEDYIDFMVDAKTVFKVYYLAHVVETKQKLFEDELFNFDTPTDMTVECPKDVMEEMPFKVQLSFKNPLSRPLVGGMLEIEGSKIEDISVKQKDVPPFGVFQAELTVVAKSTRKRRSRTKMHVNFSSKQLCVSKSQWVSILDKKAR